LYIITDAVAPERATFFSEGTGTYSEIISFSWSPDGQYLALIVAPSPGSPNVARVFQLAVLDTEGMRTKTFCNPEGLGSVVGAVWSPDSRYVLIGLVGSGGPTDFSSLAVDITSGSAYSIGSFLVGGWLR
jgi:hypothetical protein